jgi:hypothetical protein
MKLENIIKLKFNQSEVKKPSSVNFADYPWDQCIEDQLQRGYTEDSANNICGWIKANYQQMAEEGGLENACWPGYIAIGTKELDGRIVPNCVPEENQSKQKFVIPSPESGEDKDKYISRCISSIIDEYGQEQAAAICYGQLEKK